MGAILVGFVAVVFASIANLIAQWQKELIHTNAWIMLALSPAGLALSIWLTRNYFKGAQGSGIPQVIASLHMSDMKTVDQILALKTALGKILLTLLGLACGASIGREGPTCQVGASLLHNFGQLGKVTAIGARRSLILAGGAAGVAAAFNTPLGGIVFAIEELSHSFEQKTTGTVLAAVVISGVTTIALIGNYSYFGHANVGLPVGVEWLGIMACSILGGISGGLFSRILITTSKGLPGKIGGWLNRHPVSFAALCGLVLAMIGLISHGTTYGTGYEQAKEIVIGDAHYPASFFIFKFLATIVSYCSGIPGGIFAPSLAIGAGLGGWVAQFFPHATVGTLVLLGMVAYFSAVVQSPLTAAVIVMEMTDNQQILLALLATSFAAYGISSFISHPLYSSLAKNMLAVQEHPAVSPSLPKP
ncbi:H(+)/Cl(-) exchange transporter ClcA [Entomobacter blattae]|uniref:H(+)/Cl(-) exchange transporter ClcA n=1 Tax=Entomobacter blattae TaxID=2762277 RepID=A0A7H1NQT3_9PROT|nr:H(+)/Cl(-) exchange transporter ClcA [Entomobacter blattae]